MSQPVEAFLQWRQVLVMHEKSCTGRDRCKAPPSVRVCARLCASVQSADDFVLSADDAGNTDPGGGRERRGFLPKEEEMNQKNPTEEPFNQNGTRSFTPATHPA